MSAKRVYKDVKLRARNGEESRRVRDSQTQGNGEPHQHKQTHASRTSAKWTHIGAYNCSIKKENNENDVQYAVFTLADALCDQ